MKVIQVLRGKEPQIKEIANSLEAMQSEVGGYIESVTPFKDDVAIIVNEEGKLNGWPPNRFLVYKKANYVEALCGPILIVGLGEENFTDIPENVVKKYATMFKPDIVYI